MPVSQLWLFAASYCNFCKIKYKIEGEGSSEEFVYKEIERYG